MFMKLADIWPQHGVTIITERLELRLPYNDELVMLATVARNIQPAHEQHYQMPWMYGPSPQMERELIWRFWKHLGEWSPDNWALNLVAFLEGRPIGLQDIWAKNFSTARSVLTGSWLGLEFQGQGYGTEMRAGVLDFAFAHLGAKEALSDYLEGNEKSASVSRKLGYQPNGQVITSKEGKPVTKYHVRLTKDNWQSRRKHKVEVLGLKTCSDLFNV